MKNFMLLYFLIAAASLNAQKSRLFFDAVPGSKDANQIILHRYNNGLFMGNFKSMYFIDQNLNINDLGQVGSEKYSFYNTYNPNFQQWGDKTAFIIKIDSSRNSILLSNGDKQETLKLPGIEAYESKISSMFLLDKDTMYIPVSGDIMKYSTSKGYQSLREATGINISALPLFAHQGKIYFEHQKDLMVSDFTLEGTKILMNAKNFFSRFEYYYEFLSVKNKVYYTYTWNETGEFGEKNSCDTTQLWSTEGTRESTNFINSIEYFGHGDPDLFSTVLLDRTLFYKGATGDFSCALYAYDTEIKTKYLALDNLCNGPEYKQEKQIKNGSLYTVTCQGLSSFKIGDTKIEHELVIENNRIQKFEVYDSLILFTVRSEDGEQDILWMKNRNTNELTYIDSLGHLPYQSFLQTFGILTPNGKSIIYPKYTPNLGKELWIYELAGVNGIKEQTINFSLYPNPAKSSTQLELAHEGNYTIEVQNISGAVLGKQKFTGKSYTLNTCTLTAGLYLIKVSNGQEQQVQKLVVY